MGMKVRACGTPNAREGGRRGEHASVDESAGRGVVERVVETRYPKDKGDGEK